MGDAAIPVIAPLPRGITAIGVFLLFGAVIAFLAGTSLVHPAPLSIACGPSIRTPTMSSHLLENPWVSCFCRSRWRSRSLV